MYAELDIPPLGLREAMPDAAGLPLAGIPDCGIAGMPDIAAGLPLAAMPDCLPLARTAMLEALFMLDGPAPEAESRLRRAS